MKKEGNDEGRDPTQEAHVHGKHFRNATWRIHERPILKRDSFLHNPI